MLTLNTPATRVLALAAFVGGLAISAPVFAAPDDMDNTAPPASTAPMKPTKASSTAGHSMKKMTPEQMKEDVENRIKTLHTKLMITPDQEASWGEVAQAMRDSETSVSTLIQERHDNTTSMTAVDDLGSYQKIAQAHADGLKNVTAAFQTLYDSMSDDQKANADKVFGTFEGHEHQPKPAAK